MSMKKFLVVCLSLICLMFTFGLTACGDKAETLDLADCEIGYELPVYPNCKFNYKITYDDYKQQTLDVPVIVNIDNINAILVEKNDINEDDVLEQPFHMYKINLVIVGHTDKELSGRELRIWLIDQLTGNTFSNKATIDENGNINWNYYSYCNSILQRISFYQLGFAYF